MKVNARLARGLVWALALVPLMFFLAGLAAHDFRSVSSVLNMLGRLTGALGLALLLLAAALSARVPGFDQPFGGLTKLWHTHHLLGAGALLLLMAHPLLLALASTAHGYQLPVKVLFPPLDDIATWSGWLALILMMIFLAPSFSFFGPPNYERWKRIHALAGPAVILALVHTFLFSRTMPANLDILIWSLFALLGVGAVAWRLVFSRRAGRLNYSISAVEAVANNVVELTLEPKRPDKHLQYQAGNFVYMTPLDKQLSAGCGEEHPYTLSSSPTETKLRIAIKDLGDASRAIQSVRPGTEVQVEGPYGRFFPVNGKPEQPELWVAGGIGITPFLARLRHFKALGQAANVHLIYAVQDEARALYADELRDLAQAITGAKLTFHYFYREGPISADFLLETCPDLSQRETYICGPLPLNKLVQDHLRGLGRPRYSIHTEEFELL
ncbi:MAG: ferric reductase-like transmembrane domain-containing protein [Wenzhouxiangella sp.]|nr:ferric reductase-like transmembrane domain-containing protein [Wenzhouxiangella sp.]